MKKITLLFALALCSLALTGCGQTGPLYQPDEPASNQTESNSGNDVPIVNEQR